MPSNNINKNLLPVSVSLAVAGALILAGCGKDEAQYVEVTQLEQKPVVTEQPAHTPDDGHNHATTEANPGLGFTYAIPAGWSEKPPSRMVLAAFQVGQPPETVADLSVSAFPGDVGGQLANINRWRRQVGLGPVAPEAVQDFITDMEVSGLPAWQVAFTGPESASKIGEPVRMVVTAVSQGGKTWFFKLMGGESAIESEMANYQAFMDSVSY